MLVEFLIVVCLAYIALTRSFRSRLLQLTTSSTDSLKACLLSETFQLASADTTSVPYIIHQTHSSRQLVPEKVTRNLQKFAPEYQRMFYSDDDIKVFLAEYFQPQVLQAFIDLRAGAHKADLFRYCILYVHGGVYMDIKTELIRPIHTMFPKGCISTVLGCHPKIIYNGIVAAPPQQPIFLYLIDSVLKSGKSPPYGLFIREFYRFIERDAGSVRDGHLEGKLQRYVIYVEHCSTNANKCYDGLDRYGICSFIKDGKTNIIKTRYSDFPWTKEGTMKPKSLKEFLISRVSFIPLLIWGASQQTRH